MYLRILSFAAVMLAAAVMSAPASAFIIDDFNDNQSVSATSGTPIDNNNVLGGMVGGNRTIQANWASGANSVDAEVNAGGSSLLNVSLGADTLGSIDVLYEPFAATDFTNGGLLNSIAMSIPFDDLPVDITVHASSASGLSTLTHNPGGGIFAPVALPFLFADFVGTADFTELTGLHLHIVPLFPATDLQIDFIESTFTPPSGVPEPSTIVLGALGLAGFGLILRKKRQG